MLAEVLSELVVVLGAAVAVLLACFRLRIPAVVGLLVTGVLLGPAGFGLVARGELIDLLAELGVVFLLFSIGLDLSLDELRQVRRAFSLGGPVYVGGILGLSVALAVLFDRSPRFGLFVGFLVTLSSTAVVFKLLAEAREMGTPHGRLVVGICLFQDFLLAPMLLLLPVLGTAGAIRGGEVLLRLAGGVALVIGIFALARLAMPWVLGWVARTRVREAFVLGAVTVCLGLALATHAAGLSLALGAFLAGLLVSECDYSHQIVAEVSPLRDLFNSIFFVSIGLLLEREILLTAWPVVLAVTAGVIVVKLLLGLVTAAALGTAQRTGVLAAVALAQIGEFSFVLAKDGHAQGLLGPVELQVFLAAAILTLLATPLLIAAGPRLAVLARALHLPGGRTAVGERPPGEELRDHVILVGFGVGGQNLARVLREARIPYLVVDLAPEVVRAAQHTGERVLYGDATRPEILERAGVRTARVAVFAISDHDALRRAVRTARQLQPGLHLIARTRRVADLEALTADGAQEIVAEEFESSLELFARVLAHYHVPRHVVAAQERLLRGDGYRGLRATLAGERLPAEALAALAAGTVDIYRVPPGSRLAGRTVLELDLRRHTGANLLALVRDGDPQPNVSGIALAAEDLLVLSGSHQEIEAAFHLLDREGGSPFAPAAA